MKKIISWNVNGIRASAKKGFFEWLEQYSPDVLCLQETKAHRDQLNDDFTSPPGYRTFWQSAKKKGYSGVAVYTKEEPLETGNLGIGEFDDEGRTLILEYPKFTLVAGYFPNSQDGGARLDYKLGYCDAVLEFCRKKVTAGGNVVVCGDMNIAHKPIDLAHPKGNEGHPGYLPEERAWMDTFESAGYTDTFRAYDTSAENYTWWSYITRARERNVGWRLDYFWVNDGFMSSIDGGSILADVYGSDHCPVQLDVKTG